MRDNNILFYFKNSFDPALIAQLIGAYKGKILLSAGQKPYFSYRLTDAEKKTLLVSIKSLLQAYKDLHNREK